MRRASPAVASWALLAMTLIGAAPLRAQDAASEAKEAVSLAQAGRHREARARAEGALAACVPGATGRDCRARLQYTLGYVDQLQLETQRPGATDEAALVLRSIRAYQAALVESPGHGPSLANLATLHLRLGDGLLASDRIPNAAAAYEAAVRYAPAAEAPRSRLADAWIRQPAESLPAVLDRLREWEASWPNVAREGYLGLIQRTHASSPAIADRALVRFVSLLASRGAVSATDLDALPREWKARGPEELRTYLRQPWGDLAFLNWWRQDRDRQDALARLSVGLGKGFLVGGKGPDWPERCWKSALQVMPRLSAGRVDLERELALLYFQIPGLDQGGQKMARLIDHVFDEKAAAYLNRDLETIQRYHVTLGLIFSEQGRFSTPNDPRGAHFQLRRAIETAEQRRLRGGLVSPLPEIHERLAKGLAKADQPRAAVDAFLGAARAHLDSDDLEGAVRMLEGATALQSHSSPASAFTLRSLRSLTQLRMALSSPSADPAAVKAALAWGAEPPSRVPADFVDRQRFKLLSDATTAGGDGGQVEAAARALTVAVDKKVQLLSPRDLLRVEEITAKVESRAGKTVGDAGPGPGEVALKAGAEVSSRPVRVSAETVLKARVLEDAPPGAEVIVQGETVTIETRPRSAKEAQDYGARIRKIPGVAAVVVREKPESPPD